MGRPLAILSKFVNSPSRAPIAVAAEDCAISIKTKGQNTRSELKCIVRNGRWKFEELFEIQVKFLELLGLGLQKIGSFIEATGKGSALHTIYITRVDTNNIRIFSAMVLLNSAWLQIEDISVRFELFPV